MLGKSALNSVPDIPNVSACKTPGKTECRSSQVHTILQNKAYPCTVVDGSDDPGQAQAQEDVDGVGAGDVSDRVVSIFLAHGRSFARESVRQGGAQRNESNGYNGKYSCQKKSQLS